MNKCIFFLGLLLVFVSCKDEVKEPIDKPEAAKESFEVALDAVIKKDDSLQIFYCENGEINYDGVKMVWAKVKGSETLQTVKFKFPEDAVPTKMRLDISTNKDQSPIEFKKFSMKYYDKAYEIKDTMFFQYFIPSHQIEWNRKQAIATFKIKDGEFFDPQFGSRTNIEEELTKMFN